MGKLCENVGVESFINYINFNLPTFTTHVINLWKIDRRTECLLRSHILLQNRRVSTFSTSRSNAETRYSWALVFPLNWTYAYFNFFAKHASRSFCKHYCPIVAGNFTTRVLRDFANSFPKLPLSYMATWIEENRRNSMPKFSLKAFLLSIPILFCLSSFEFFFRLSFSTSSGAFVHLWGKLFSMWIIRDV